MRSIFLSSRLKFTTHPKKGTENPQTEPFPSRGKKLNLRKAALFGGNWNGSVCLQSPGESWVRVPGAERLIPGDPGAADPPPVVLFCWGGLKEPLAF